ncbi:MAG: hypothetical protein D6675_11960 [Gemmatimonadetes bacterium]|nr:MAG: hypothetical protein D6675_11960 [Gemmatimonadota bacterium]
MHILEEIQERDIKLIIANEDESKKVLILSFVGTFDVLTTEAVFLKHRQLLKDYLEDATFTERVIFDLYDLTQINSFAIGHFTRFLLTLYKQKIPVTVVVNPESLTFQTLEYCGFFELHGLHVQKTSLSKGLEDHQN